MVVSRKSVAPFFGPPCRCIVRYGGGDTQTDGRTDGQTDRNGV